MRALLPLDAAKQVPLNAALIASSTYGNAVFWLRQLGPSGALAGDAGAGPDTDAGPWIDPGYSVPLEVECAASDDSAQSGAVCVARAALLPHTRYEWSVLVDSPFARESPEPVGQSPEAFTLWHLFETGAELAQPLPAMVDVSVTENRRFVDPPCGDWGTALLEFDGTRLQQPLVANIHGFTPSYIMHAAVLPPREQTELRLWNFPDCAPVELYDQFGNVTSLREICFDAELAPSAYDPNGMLVDLPGPDPEGPGPDVLQPGEDDADVGEDEAAGGGTSEPGSPASAPTPSRIDEGVVTRGVNDDAAQDSGCALTFARPTSRGVLGLTLALAALGRRRQARSRRSRS